MTDQLRHIKLADGASVVLVGGSVVMVQSFRQENSIGVVFSHSMEISGWQEHSGS